MKTARLQPELRTVAVVALAALLWAAPRSSIAAEYQFGIALKAPANGPQLYTQANFFLYIPPRTRHLRALLWAPANIIERRLADDPALRAEAARDDFAIIFFQAGWKKEIFDSHAIVDYLQAAADRFADQSGYSEIRTVPWILIGHSGNSQFVQAVGRHAPGRVVASVVIKGALPAVAKDGSTSGLVGIPILGFTGEYEEVMPPGKVRNGWWPVTVERFYDERKAVPQALVSCMLDRDHGHVGWEPSMTKYLVLFLHKAISARLNPDGSLRPVAFGSGWLGDPQEQFATASVANYKGNPARAFWFFDEEQARAWETLFKHDEHKRDQMLAFVQDGKIADWWNGWALQAYKFEPLGDGESFEAKAVPRDRVPEPFSDAGRSLGHNADATIQYSVVGWAGQMLQTGPNRFRVAFDREGVNGRTTHMLIGASLAGNDVYKGATAVATLDVPAKNTEGKPQRITFSRIADISPDVKRVELKATVNTRRRVDYYVSYGPAVLDDGGLRIIGIPERARFPIAISVTAYQWGTAAGERFQTAQPVTMIFYVQEPKHAVAEP